MISDYHFTGQTKQGNVLNFTVHINLEEIQKDQDCDLIIRRIILDSFNISEKLSKPEIHINIINLDVPGDKINYEIIEETDHPVHAVAIKQFEKNKVVKEIVSKRILPVDEAKEEIGQLSLLERFAVIENKPRGFFGKIKQVLAVFLSKILYPFHLLQTLWHILTNQSEKKLKWDINLLAEICGTTPPDKMSMMHSMQYMSTMLDREREEVADPVLQLRFKNGLKIAQDVDLLRRSFSKSSALKVVKDIQHSISEVGDKKILIPVGYMQGDKLVEAILEVSKDTSGKYHVSFISAQEETRTLFDRELGIEVSSQSLRREITDIESKDLLAVIPTLIELQASPNCLKGKNANWQIIFLQTLKFEKSKVEAGQTTELYRVAEAPGHLGEVISYVKGEKGANVDDAKSFDLAIRLRLFLEVCQANKKGLSDQKFWTSVRTTARYLATQIEQEKSILGSRKEQGIELTRIYGELKQLLDQLDLSPPVLVNLSDKTLPLSTGLVEVVTYPETPLLTAVKMESTVYSKVDPPFAVLDPTRPLESIQNWGLRCRRMIAMGGFKEAAMEAKLMVKMIPPTSHMQKEDADTLLASFNDIGEAIARGAVEKEQSTLQDIEAILNLNYFAFMVARTAGIVPDRMLDNFAVTNNRLFEELSNCHSTHNIRTGLPKLNADMDANLSTIPNMILQPLLNLAKFSEMTIKGAVLSHRVMSNEPIQFTLEGNLTYHSNLDIKYVTPLPLRAPSYAHDVTQEITNRYVSEFCCLGCIRDNCPNYNRVPQKQHRFHPLYMLHNYVDTFCDQLTKKGQLRRDEITDLMYTQQTNQNANMLWTNVHGQHHGFDIANGFDQNDRSIQLMNTFMVYLDHPHFFKQPDLRWQFETKIFKYGALSSLLNNITVYEPFFISMLNKLAKEISISTAIDDQETAAYLMYICDELQQAIKASTVSDQIKTSLQGLMPKDRDLTIQKWAKELVGKNDQHLLNTQMMVLPLVLQNYYKKFLQNNSDPCFDSEDDLEFILSAVVRLERNDKLKKLIDPEIRDRYLQLMSLILDKTKEKVSSEAIQGDFINKVIANINSNVAGLKLQWDLLDFPTFLALGNKGDLYQFDLTTGKIIHNPKQPKRLGELPDSVKRYPGVERLFGSALKESWNIRGTPPQSEEKILAYSHDKFPDFRIVVKQGSSDSTANIPEIFIERRIPALSGKTAWISFIDFNTQVRMRTHQSFSQTPDLPPKVAIAIGDRTCWIDRAKNMIHVFDIDSNKPYAIITLRNKKDITNVADLHLLESDLHLLRASDKELEQYSSVEDPSFIQVLGRKNKAIQVSYPRYEMASSGVPLSFDIGKKGITTQAFPNYKLASNGVRPGSADPIMGVTPLPATFDAFQLLQKDGDERVLIPLRGYEQQYAISGASLPSSKMVFPDAFEKCPMYEFSVDWETNRLVAKSGDAYAYLAYLSMAHWDYSSANYYLSKARTTAGYDARYDQVFEWVEKWHDDTPNGIALKLRFELFREKVLEDRQIHQIREGKLKQTEQIAIQRAPRLIQIADLYEKYTAVGASNIAGESGIDPSLELSLEDSKEVKRLIKALLDSHGNEIVDTHEPKPIRAKQIPLQSFKDSDVSNEIALSLGTITLWAFNGTDRNHTPFVLKDPRWVVQNFRDLFNQIVAGDESSIHYKQLKLQIRLISELSKSDLNLVERSGVEQAQSYLLKLITVKELDPQGFLELKNTLGPDNKLFKFNGPFFSRSRLFAIGRMNAALSEGGFDKFDLRDVVRAERKANVIRRRILHEAPDPYDLFSLTSKFFKLAKDWKPSQQTFYDFFRSLLMSEIFGNKGAKSIDSLDKIFKFLDSVAIKQPVQSMVPAISPSPKPTLTYTDKYMKLIDVAPINFDSRIGELEQEIAARPEPTTASMVVTDLSKIQPVVGEVLVGRYSQYFHKTTVAPPAINEAVFDDLSRSNEKAFVRVAEKHREDLAAYLGSKTIVSLSKGEAIKLKEELAVEREKITSAEKTLKKDLLQYVELFDTPAGILAMRRLVGKGVKPSLDFLIALWRRGETAKAWQEHPLRKLGMKEIPESSVKKLDNDIAKYLELSTIHNHLNRIGEMADSYLGTCGEADASLGDTQLANELFEGVQTKRNYSLTSSDNADYRDLLYVEYTQKIIMYADQIQTLREMTFDPNAVRQLRMGRGKTEVIMPILAKKKATGKNLVVLMLPEELLEANCRGLDIKNRLLFGQEMHRFDFSRKTDKSPDALKKIHLRLLQTIQDKGFIISTKRSLLSLKNSYILLLNKLNKLQPHEDKSEILGQIREMSKIISLFYNQADVLADEVDACLDVRKEVNFSLGASLRIDQIKGDVGADLMRLIMDQKLGDPLYELKDALIHNTQAAISPEIRQRILTDLVKVYYDSHAERISAINKDTFVKYIMNDPLGVEAEAWIFKQKENNNDLFKQITTLKAYIGRGFGTTFGRIGNVNYGRDPISGIYTIPYKASNTPSINSEFDDDIERISFTYQDYIQNGVSFKQVYQILAMMQKQAVAEMRSCDSDEFVSLIDTQAAKAFKEFVKEVNPDGKLRISITLASMNDPKMVEALVTALNESPKGRLAFCQKVVVRNMKQYSAQINSMSTDAPQLVKNFGGFTGTPWNIHTYHDKIDAKPNLGVDGMTWSLMLGRKVDIKTFAFDSEKPIDSLLSNIDIVGNCQAVIDTGAYLRGASNEEFIERTLEIAQEKGLPVNAGIYFDESGKIVKKQQGESKSLPIEIAPSTDLMTNITMYDQAHTVGADIKQGKKAKAVVTIGENTFIRDLFQAVWRLRQLHQEQTVVLAVSDKIKERILGQENRELTIEDIHKFCLMNETRREADDNFIAEKEKIQGYAKRALLPEIANVVNSKASDEIIMQMAQKFATEEARLFVKVRPKEEAYDDYGTLTIKDSPSKTYARLKVKEGAKSLKIAAEFEQMNQTLATTEFTKISHRIASRPNQPDDWFPNVVESHEGAGSEVEAEAEEEAQAEVEREAEVEQEFELMLQTETMKAIFIPIVQTGAAGHGDVKPLTKDAVENLISNQVSDFGNFRKLNDAISYFDKTIACSAVFERNLTDKPAPPQSVFYSNRKPVKQVLITKSVGGIWTMLIPTIHEAHGACREFVAATRAKAVEVAISAGKPLIMYKSGADRTAALPFTDEVDKENFYRLYVQAKLFNGEIEFGTKEEQDALKKWLIEKGSVGSFKEFFEQNILGAKPSRFADAYSKSSLFKIFNELIEASLPASS